MRLYTVHLRRHGLDPDRDVVLVKEGFCWPSLLFGPLWALWHGLWLVAAGLAAIELVVAAVSTGLALEPFAKTVVAAAVSVGVGFVANDLRRWTLARRNFELVSVVSGDTVDSAVRRFLDGRSAPAADLLA
jgi:hypothetical protein